MAWQWAFVPGLPPEPNTSVSSRTGQASGRRQGPLSHPRRHPSIGARLGRTPTCTRRTLGTSTPLAWVRRGQASARTPNLPSPPLRRPSTRARPDRNPTHAARLGCAPSARRRSLAPPSAQSKYHRSAHPGAAPKVSNGPASCRSAQVGTGHGRAFSRWTTARHRGPAPPAQLPLPPKSCSSTSALPPKWQMAEKLLPRRKPPTPVAAPHRSPSAWTGSGCMAPQPRSNSQGFSSPKWPTARCGTPGPK
mmetsp:Transcript_32394/g.89525  ORF Transcript_32394/g.89525 Transcript_32394/m.89525 type:complete len:249 (+) Transcript_32394:1270-2016(+)